MMNRIGGIMKAFGNQSLCRNSSEGTEENNENLRFGLSEPA